MRNSLSIYFSYTTLFHAVCSVANSNSSYSTYADRSQTRVQKCFVISVVAADWREPVSPVRINSRTD